MRFFVLSDIIDGLGPNHRTHPYVFREAKRTAQLLVTDALNRAQDGVDETFTPPIQVTCRRYYAGTARRWDRDNFYAAMKAYFDAIKVGIGVDDRESSTRMEVEQIRILGGTKDDSCLEFEIVQLPGGTLNSREIDLVTFQEYLRGQGRLTGLPHVHGSRSTPSRSHPPRRPAWAPTKARSRKIRTTTQRSKPKTL